MPASSMVTTWSHANRRRPTTARSSWRVFPGDEATVKTFSRRGNTIVLKPANERLAPMEFDADDVRIFGKVVTVLRRL